MAKKLAAQICFNQNDLEIIPVDDQNLSQQMGFSFEMFKPDINLEEGQWIKISSLDFKVIPTPGHSQGSVCFYV